MDIMEILCKYISEIILAIMSTIFLFIFTKLKNSILDISTTFDVLRNSMQTMLRNELIIKHNKYTERGFVPIHERENMQEMYSAYKSLGGNGVMESLMDKLDELPTHKENEDE